MAKATISTLFVSVLVFCCFSIALSNAVDDEPYRAQIEALLKNMTLAEKIGQMTQIERGVASRDVIKNYFIGSVLSGGGSVPKEKATPKEWVDMVNEFQNGSLSTRLKIPMLYGIDAVHGHNNAFNSTIFPHNVGLGATRDADLVKRIGIATALEVRATGIPYDFAPCIAVCRDPRWGRCYESYSENPKLVQNMTEIILGLQGDVPSTYPKRFPFVGGQNKTLACAKHFAGDGGTTKGINENNTVASWREMRRIHLPAYKDSVAKGVGTVMVSYSSWNGVKMHANGNLITNYLKKKLKFKGFVISDWEGIDRITTPSGANYSSSILAGVNAGIDMVMVPNNYEAFISNLTSLVNDTNKIHISRIDDAVRRILRVKYAMGLFDYPLADYSMAKYLGCKEHRELAREAVRKSLVLLKNGNESEYNPPLLPLPKKGKKILVAGSHANNIGLQCGGWTIKWQGQPGNITVGTTILEAINSTVDREVIFIEKPKKSTLKGQNFSYAIVVVGEPTYAETSGDSLNLTLPASGIKTIKNVCGLTKCVVVLITGRPVVIEPYLPKIDGLVAAWLPGTEGQGVADVLFGDYGFTGKLARTWFKTVDQLPMNVGDRHYDPLFAYGYGLTTKKPGNP